MKGGKMANVAIEIEERKDRGKIVTVTLENAARLNTLTTPIIGELTGAFNRFRSDEDLRLMVLAGAGDRSFIGGVDLNELAGLTPRTAETFINRLHHLCTAIRHTPVPVIARISGYCLGGGLEVAAACDMRAATDKSQFGMPEVNVGIPSVIEAALLPRLIGWGKTSELVYTGRMLSAQEALACGLVEKVVPENELDIAIREWADAILNAGPRAVRLQKSLLREWETAPLERAIEQGIRCFGKAYETEEPRRLAMRFLDRKRKTAKL